MKSWNEWAAEIHNWAISKGFYQHTPAGNYIHVSGGFASLMMLVLTEITEADEAVSVEHFDEEVVDVLIRLLDIAAFTMTDLDDLPKTEYGNQLPFWDSTWIKYFLNDVSKAVEFDRKGKETERNEKIQEIISHLLEMADFEGVNIHFELEKKMAKNLLRPEKHGKAY